MATDWLALKPIRDPPRDEESQMVLQTIESYIHGAGDDDMREVRLRWRTVSQFVRDAGFYIIRDQRDRPPAEANETQTDVLKIPYRDRTGPLTGFDFNDVWSFENVFIYFNLYHTIGAKASDEYEHEEDENGGGEIRGVRPGYFGGLDLDWLRDVFKGQPRK
ncbi:hypothetical protein DBV05_g4040 [Lasiodiplodia theobromae]|uniref:Uncharacterized protein n=1 Tax=Lasiodiplodia theobromae TaxID=45133 RepID=A0A5N5DHE9_9PEZI|nr:hypothetical protein DBV05_g4040 [Lasiodiplodia theobromae]